MPAKSSLNQVMKRLRSITLFVVTVFFASACGLFDVDPKESGGDIGGGSGGIQNSVLAAFEAGMYEWLTDPNVTCVGCHKPNGDRSSNPLAHPTDVEISMEFTEQYVDFDSPEDSPIVQKIEGGHNCNSECADYAKSMTELIQAWAEARASADEDPEGGSGSGGGDDNGGLAAKMITAEQVIPAGIPDLAATPNQYETLSFSLDAVADGVVSGARVTLDIQRDDKVYRITNVQFVAGGNHAKVESIRTFMNGKPTTAQDLSGVKGRVRQNNTSTVFGGAALIPIQKGAGTDKFKIGFSVLEALAAFACNNLNGANGFVGNVRNQMMVRCVGCHGGNNGAATAAFNMANGRADADLCLDALDRANLSNAGQSLLVTKPQGGDGHGNINNFNAAQVIAWINSEN